MSAPNHKSQKVVRLQPQGGNVPAEFVPVAQNDELSEREELIRKIEERRRTFVGPNKPFELGPEHIVREETPRSAGVEPTQDEPSQGEPTGLWGRVKKVGAFLRKEAKWTAGSIAIGAAGALTAHVALAAAPVVASIAAGMVVSNVLTTAYRSVKENTEKDYAQKSAAAIEQGYYWNKPSKWDLFWKHAREDDILTKQNGKRLAVALATSFATFGVIKNFDAIKDGISGFFNTAGSAHAGPVSALNTSAGVIHDNFQSSVITPIDAKGNVLLPTDHGGNPSMAAVNQTNIDAGPVSAAPEPVNDVVQPAVEEIVQPPVVSALDQAQEILGRELTTPQQMKDAALSLLKTHQDVAIGLYQQASDLGNMQASIDLAYFQYHGLHNVVAEPKSAIDAMKDIAANTKGALHKIAQEFVDQWSGAHPTNVSPVHLYQQEVAAAAAKKAAQEASQRAAQEAANLAAQHAQAAASAATDAAAGVDVVANCHLDVGSAIGPNGIQVPAVQPSCDLASETIRTGQSVDIDGMRFKFNGVAASTREWIQDKVNWAAVKKVGDMLNGGQFVPTPAR